MAAPHDDPGDVPGEDRGDDVPAGPRPSPSERPWVHPAELQAFTPAPARASEPPRPREWVIGLVSAGAGAMVAVLVLVAFGALGGRERSALPPPVVTSPDSPIDYAVAQRVAATVAPSIVTVTAEVPTPDGRSTRVQASGVVLRTDRAMTSAHVVAGATKVEVHTKAGETFTAQVVGADPTTDLALLVVDGIDVDPPTAELIDESTVGDVVVAVGAGKASEGWTSPGVVQERNWIGSYGTTPVAVPGLLITSTATTADTSGGGLFDPEGKIVGVLVTMPNGTRSGLAVPIDVALNVLEQLERDKSAKHGALGVLFGADVLGRNPGATVAAAVPDGPAAHADPPLQANDVILQVGTTRVRDFRDAIAAVRQQQPTEQIELQVLRGSRTIRVRLQLGTAADGVDTAFGPVG